MPPLGPLLLPLLLFLLPFFATASPLTPRSPPESPGRNRRGIAYNDARYVKYFDVYGSHATWCYNWDSRPNGPTHTWHEFVPMLHLVRADHVGKWAADVRDAAFRDRESPTHLLGFNEPDNCEPGKGGSCIPLSTAIAAWKQYMEPQKQLKMKMYLGSPAVTNGPDGLQYLSDFLAGCTGCNIDFINIHWYDSAPNIPYFQSHIAATRSIAAGRPIWITEFQARGSDEQVKKFLDEALPWLDAQGDVHRYAYFMASTGEGMLVDGGGKGLSDLGGFYAFRA